MRVVLDTNAYQAFLRGDAASVDVVRGAEEVLLPVPVLAELRYGFANGTQGRRNEASLLRFLDSPRVRILTCDEQTTHFYAQLKLQLQKQGTPIPINDVWIAALTVQHSGFLHTYDSDFDHLAQLPRA